MNSAVSSFMPYARSFMKGAAIAIAMLAIHKLVDYVVKRMHNGENIRDSNVLLILSNVPFPMGITTMAKLHLQNHTSIIYKNIASDDDFDQAIESVVKDNNTIPELFLNAHGRPHSIHLGNTVIQTWNVNRLSKSLNLLEKNARITLHSCSTGNTKAEDFCIADLIAQCAQGRFVTASSDLVNPIHTNVQWEGTSLKTTFGKPKGPAYSISSIFNNYVGFLSFGYFGIEDTTVHFHYPIKDQI
jgi:hypothetical protein